MNTPEDRRTAGPWAASRSHEIVMHLIDAPDDLEAWQELERISDGIRAAASTRAVDEISGLADTLIEFADRRVMDGRVAQDVETAVARLLVLSERASQVTDPAMWPEDEDPSLRVLVADLHAD